ncbi:MAG: TraR/DksA C4-type zinc finger protein [Opitutales bacterium]|nr:TraR/DksA C4-type zinc finger protein [Opitutales bacterium]MCH8541518.1 TraR/DksA C4-type zinc finger protein [Opitutales bacterium]
MLSEHQQNFLPFIDQRLEEVEAELAKAKEQENPIKPDIAIGRLSRLDAMQMQQMALASKRRLQEEKVRLVEARNRIARGTYGQCQVCRKDIPFERLFQQLDATACVECLGRNQ